LPLARVMEGSDMYQLMRRYLISSIVYIDNLDVQNVWRRNKTKIQKSMVWCTKFLNIVVLTDLLGLSQICCLPSKSSAVVGEAIVQLLSASIRPMIPQSDNGSEFLWE
jgi:hypothetical protein